MKEMTAVCPYCKQALMIRVPEDAAEDDIREEAVRRCTCEDAVRMQKIEENIIYAKSYIEKELDAGDGVKDIMLKSVGYMPHTSIKKVTVKSANSVYTVERKKDGSFKVEKKTTDVEKMEK